MADLATLPALTETQDVAKPASTRDVNLGAGDITEFKRTEQERGNVDHNRPSSESGQDNIGAHKIVHLLVQTTIQSLANAGCLYSKDVSAKAELHYKDEDGNETQITNVGKVNLGSKKVDETDIGDGKYPYYDLASGTIKYGSITTIPSGLIALWSGTIATIPSGWVLCNGANSTPDLRDKFVVGAKQDDGGAAKTNITGSLTQSGGDTSHNHGGATGNPSTSGYNTTDSGYNPATVHPHTHTIASDDHIPTYYALAFIMKS